MHNGPLKLMIPGPVQPDDDVLDAMGGPVQAHYGPAFTSIYTETTAALRPVFGTQQADIYLLVGSGSSGLDAYTGSALSAGEKILVGVNGYFGQRLVSIAESYGLRAVPVESEWGTPLSVEQFEQAMREHPDARAVSLVHLETSTAVVNPIEEIAPLARRHGLLTIIDAVSSLGGLPMKMDEWGIDLCASATQKCLGAPPGLSPVAVGPRGWDAIDENPDKGHGWYLNLRTWRQYSLDWSSWHPFPVTMATNNVMALKTSLKHLLDEGIENRLERYRALALRLREGLRSIGMQPYTPDEILAPVLTAAYGPEGVPTSVIVEYMAEEHGIKISGGLGLLKDKIIRIGHMSPTVSEADIDQVIGALEAFRIMA